MRTKDWKSTKPAKILLVGEDSNLQWSDTVTEYAMFADYYFRQFPWDHGERSRNVEAQNLFAHLRDLTSGRFKADEIYVTNLCREQVEPAPKGKRVLIPEAQAVLGLDHIKWILMTNPTIEWVFLMSMQTNYWLQKLDFYTPDADFIAKAEPRRVGQNDLQPYYQPVDGKAFTKICGNIYPTSDSVQIVPILAAKDYPLNERNLAQFGVAYETIRTYFKRLV